MNILLNKNMWYWYMLLLAIILEITGTSLMKFFSLQGENYGYIFMILFISLSYFSLSKAVIKIPISTAYAVWEGIGLIGTAAVAYFIFGENMSLLKLLAFIAILTGLLMVKYGTSVKQKQDGEQHDN